MKRLYIPTSSMNFNGILSSESISPRSFYERRGFGYRRWTTIPENENENVILLYETPFSFERPISDVEDHPMMIEITTDEDFPLANASGVRYSDHTIYLDPWNTKFIFFDEQDKRVALSLSDNSLETKMLPLYTKNGICLGRYEKLRMPSVKLQQSLCVSGLERDKQLNKMKGLLYGYYIGANLSSSKETAQQYRTLMELRDLVAAILSSENHSYTPPQGARLSELFARFQENDPNLSWLFRYIGSSQNLNPFLDDARKHGWSIPNILDAEAIKVSLTSDDGGKRVVELLDKKHQALELYDKQSHKLLNPDSGEVHVVEGVLNSISILPDKQENELLVRLVNNVQVDGKLSSIKDDVSDQITEFAKELYGSAWGNSMIRQQLNGIRRYVRGQEADVDWNNTLIASIASVLSRGDEWDKMLSFMRRKGMSDYRVAFALYGAFTGFANMTRDFTDLLLTLDSKYVAEVYTEFHGQLHGTPVSTKSFADEYMPAHSSVSKAMPKDHQLVAANHNSFQGLSGIVLPAFNRVKGEKGIKPKDKLEEGLQRCLQDVGENATVEQFLARLGKQYSDYGWKPKNKPFKSLKEKLYSKHETEIPENGTLQTKKQYIESPSIFGEDTKEREVSVRKNLGAKLKEADKRLFGFEEDPVNESVKTIEQPKAMQKLLLEDTSWIEMCSGMIKDKSAKDQFEIDMKWFIDNHQKEYHDPKKGVVPGRYYEHDRSNSATLDRLERYIENKLTSEKPKLKWLRDKYSKIPIGQILTYLRSRYGV